MASGLPALSADFLHLFAPLLNLGSEDEEEEEEDGEADPEATARARAEVRGVATQVVDVLVEVAMHGLHAEMQL